MQLSDADFDAYLPSRATSNAFVRGRIPVKEKLLALGRELGAAAASQGLALDVVASDERPSIFNKKSVTEQWVFLWRDAASRAVLERASEQQSGLSAALSDPTPFLKHAFLGLHLDSTVFDVCWRLHRDAWADAKNARTRLENEASRVSSALAALPNGFVVGVAGGDSVAASSCDPATVKSFLDRAIETGSWLVVARSWSRAEAIALGESIAMHARQAFDALMPVHRALAWFPDDDLAAVGEDIVRNRAALEANVAEARAREAEWNAEHGAEIERRRAEAVVETRERLAAQERPRSVPTGRHPRSAHPAPVATSVTTVAPPNPPRVEAPRRSPEPEAAPAHKHFPLLSEAKGGRDFRERAPIQRPPVRKDIPDDQLVETAAPVAVGSRVRIRQGAFAGKSGTVTQLDARGAARVAVGALTARVEVGDLVTLGEKQG